ncbi:MAG TPA: nucleotidyltransferase domain-containing protein [Gaiellaceae bacterium]|nr:nucleotidyltransferase domain-containing protein [Gaiellaceae bacterium]
MRTSLAELASELDTTDRTLRRALNQGLLRARRPSPRTADLSLAERSYLRQVWPLLARLRELLRTEPDVSLAVLFGSWARGDARDASDVDLLGSLRDRGNARRVASRLSDRLGRRVQLVTLEDARGAPLLLREVLREGRVLVDRDEGWSALLRDRERIERAARREHRLINDAFEAAFGAE